MVTLLLPEFVTQGPVCLQTCSTHMFLQLLLASGDVLGGQLFTQVLGVAMCRLTAHHPHFSYIACSTGTRWQPERRQRNSAAVCPGNGFRSVCHQRDALYHIRKGTRHGKRMRVYVMPLKIVLKNLIFNTF